MRRILFTSVLVFLGTCAFGQIDSKHSLELSTGCPELMSNIYPPGNMDNPATADAEKIGQKRESICPWNLTLTYAYRIASRWDIGARFNARGWFYKSSQYPEKDYGKGGYDWNAKPLSSETCSENRGVATSLFGRYYWSYKEGCQWYSSVGIGINYKEHCRLEPDLIPIGLHFGKKRVYGILELSFGTVGTGLIAGIGCRL